MGFFQEVLSLSLRQFQPQSEIPGRSGGFDGGSADGGAGFHLGHFGPSLRGFLGPRRTGEPPWAGGSKGASSKAGAPCSQPEPASRRVSPSAGLGLDGEGRTGGSTGACRCRGSAVNFHHWPLAIGGEEATFGIGKRGFRGKASGRSRRPKFIEPRGAPCRASRAPGPRNAGQNSGFGQGIPTVPSISRSSAKEETA
ncbi:MAG: hypothetical protein M2R45_04194 [Verrucomicrobia subdivision 3 bacterium]|nr:hypothetical protein [Limisphaerales bacterium]MCS1417069.1 hypothetical protein [Limisphaerales bacterium]